MIREMFDNPVVTKELRGRMRGARTYWLLFGYVLLLSLILFISYLGWWTQHANDMQNGGGAAGFTVGRNFFKILFYSQAVMMALITPALTAGAITVEREQRTFELLRGSILRPGAIVWGKLSSSVSFVILLLTSSLPLLSLCFLLGGVSPGEVFFAYLLLIGDAFLFGAIGLCWSSFAAGTATATVLSYVTLILFFLVTFPFSIPALDESGNIPNYGFCALNPVGAVTGAVIPEHYYGWTLPAWLPALLLNGTLTALLILAAMNRLDDYPARRAAALRVVTLLFAGLLVFFGDGAVVGITPPRGISAAAQLLVELGLACGLLLLFVPVLVTGDLEDAGKKKRRSLRRVFGDATLPSGLPLALLLTAIVVGLTLAAVHLGGTITGYQFVSPPYGAHVLVPRVGAVTAFTDPLGQVHGVVQQASLMLLMIVAGLSGLGFLLSTLLNNRWTALTLLYLVLVLSVTIPYFSYANLDGSDAVAAAHNPAINTLYLCPLVPLLELASTLDPTTSFSRNPAFSGMVFYGGWPLWLGTGLLYLAIGLICYAVAFSIQRQRKVTRTA